MALPKFDFLWSYVDHWGQEDPEFPAIHFQGKTYTSQEVSAITDCLAKVLLSMGVQKGDRVVTILPSNPEYVFSFVAANKIGAITVPMDVRYRVTDLRRFIPHVEPKVVISASTAGENDILASLRELSGEPEFGGIEYLMTEPADFGSSFDKLLEEDYPLEEELEAAKKNQDPDEGALIIFTGGTTGVPKSALLSHVNVTMMCYLEEEFLTTILRNRGVSGNIKTVAALPPSHVGGTVELIGTALVGKYEMNLLEKWSPLEVLQTIQEEKIPFIGGVPVTYAILVSMKELAEFDLSSVKLSFLSGDKVSLELLEGIRTRISPLVVVGYGSTEAGSEVTFTDIEDDLADLARGYVGTPLAGMEVKIVDDEGNTLPAGEEGEVLIKGPLTINSYYRMPEEDKAGFSADGYCLSGDLGYMNEKGGLYIKGRKKQIIRVGSYTVLPSEIEEVVVQHPHVALAAALGIPDELYGEVVWLFVVPPAGEEVSEEEIISLCKEQLANYKVPKRVLIRDEIPLTRIGKADRETLRKEVIETLNQ